MNSDPHDAAAWRGFGMLDADDSAAFDEALRQDRDLRAVQQEMDALSAAVAVVTSRPVRPGEDHLRRIRARLAAPGSVQGFRGWAWAGWAAAASLALLLIGQYTLPGRPAYRSGTASLAAGPTPKPGTELRPGDAPNDSPPGTSPDSGTPGTASHSAPVGTPGRIPIRPQDRMTREIARLRQELAQSREREKSLFEATAGVARPVIMRMAPPGERADPDTTLALQDSPVSQLFQFRAHPPDPQPEADVPDASILATATPAPPPAPSAIPIYDAARDAGTLVVSNLPPAPDGEEYNLWAVNHPQDTPTRLGILPDAGTAPSESFDFNLGTHQAIPAGFILTRDPRDRPTPPGAHNTILLGPQGTDAAKSAAPGK